MPAPLLSISVTEGGSQGYGVTFVGDGGGIATCGGGNLAKLIAGPNPDGSPNVYIATGDSGNGMTHGAIAGMLLTDLVLRRPNKWAELYDPKRVSLRSAGDLLKENLNVAAQYADWVKPGETGDVANIHSRPDLKPPNLEVLTSHARSDPDAIFLGNQNGPYANGPLTCDANGRLVWFKPLPRDVEAKVRAVPPKE